VKNRTQVVLNNVPADDRGQTGLPEMTHFSNLPVHALKNPDKSGFIHHFKMMQQSQPPVG
jgi:hypothetical protein